MKQIITFFKTIIDGIAYLISLVFGFFEFIVDGITNLSSFLGNVPEPFLYGVTIVLFIAVTNLIIRLVSAVL